MFPFPKKRNEAPRSSTRSRSRVLSYLREHYPIETKKPFLTFKNLHRKKLSLAYTIVRVEDDLYNGSCPPETKLSQRIPGRIAHHTGLKTQWDQVLNESSKTTGSPIYGREK
jgi:hypothetical protein